MSGARVIHVRDRGQYPRERCLYIGRPSKWGNPFVINRAAPDQAVERRRVIDAYRTYLERDRPDLVAAIPHELDGMVLVCYCSPLPCHGDVLVDKLREAQASNTATDPL